MANAHTHHPASQLRKRRPLHLALIALTGIVMAASLAGCTETSNPSTSSTKVKFVDVTDQAGIGQLQYTTPDCGSMPQCGPESMSGGAAAGDYDNDGNVDLFVTRLDATPFLYRNKGDGTFEDKTAASGVDLGGKLLKSNSAGWGDVNNDGCLDLYVTAMRDVRNYLFMGDCKGHFTEEGVQRSATPVETKPTVFGMGMTFGDYDRDGFLDMFISEWRADFVRGRDTPWPQGTDHHNRLLKNNGAANPGTFTDVTKAAGIELSGRSKDPDFRGAFGFAPTLIDLNDDGWLDLAIAADFVSSGIWWNNQDGTFTDGTKSSGVGTDEAGMGSTFGDYDQDGRIDWFITAIFDACKDCGRSHAIDGNRLYHNDGNKTFSDRTDRAGVRDGAWGWGATFIDYNNDSWLDIAHTAGFHMPGMPHIDRFRNDPTFFQRNNGDGTFTEIGEEVGIRDSKDGRGLLALDYNNDGAMDLLLVQHGLKPRLFKNDGGSKNGWVNVKAVGSKAPRDGVGARIRVTYDKSKAPLEGVVTAGDNFQSMNPLLQHFGVGSGKAKITEVRVSWPSGCAQIFRDVERNTTVEAREADCGTQSSW